MSEELANAIALWILLPSLALTVLVVGATALGTRRGVRARRREEQIARLDQAAAERRGRQQNFEIDWVRYREIPKAEIITMLGKHGWSYRGEELGDKAWVLRFDLVPAEAHGNVRETTSQHRIATELQAAEPDVRGQYRLDTSQYGDLSQAEIRTAVEAAGWSVTGTDPASAGGVLLLSRLGVTTLTNGDGPFVEGVAPAELRGDPAAVARAEEIKREKNFDPLSPEQLNWARERHKHWAKRVNRQVGLAFFYGIFGLIILFGTLGSFEPGDGSRFYVMLAIAVVLLLLFGVAVLKAVLVRRKRRVELGEFLDAYGELNALAENGEHQPRHQ